MATSTLPVSFCDLPDLPSVSLEETVRPSSEGDMAGLPARYRLGPVLGTGGTSVVYRAHDQVLERDIALKTLKNRFVQSRFLEEAQRTARLTHPAIVPVHDAGILEDGRPWFTMREVRGREFVRFIDEVHGVSVERWSETPDGWSFHRLLSSFLTICEAVGYAHEHGVVHRDLKPQNVMIGDHGEVLVVDWGLSRMENLPDAGGATMTRVGAVMGTPAYMPPEQARGEVADPRTDVWALGAILYQICTNYPPYSGGTVEWTLQRARMGVVPPLDDRRLPEELVALCESLLRERPSERPSSGTEVARRMRRYLDGVEQRERALGLVQEARRLRQEAQRFRERALLEELAFKNEIAGIPPWADPREKEAAWGRETLAAEARAEEQRLREEAEALLEAALTHDPTLPEAREGLLTTALDLHRTATSTTANRMEREIRQHLSALPPSNPVRRHALRYLHGDGVLSLHTDPPGAEALLYRYELRHRRLSEVFIKSIGKTPILEFPLPHGSYMVRIRHPDREEVAYPVQIGRLEHWDGVPPGETTPLPIWLPERLSPTAIYVPAGWAEFGSAPSIAAVLPPHRRWVDGFLIERFPVTNAQYITMLDRLAAECREDLIQEMVPHLFAGKDVDRPVYGRNPEGRFFLQPDGEGDLWHPEWPVMMISLPSARRYAEQAGGRLPSEHEWEKAARGVDGRAYPWGNAFDPSFCLMRDSRPVREALAVVDSFPVDESPYGVRGMAGNVLDWTADPFQEEPPLEERVRPVPQVESRFWVGKGGAWQHRGPACIAAARYQIAPYQRRSDLGLRLVRDLPGTAFANR